MRVRAEQLAAQLNRRLAPIYVVSGDEPFQFGQCLDGIRAAARGQGYDERIVMEVDSQFDWSTLRQYQDSLSLFAQRRLLELRLPTGKPGRQGAEALKGYAEHPADDTILILGALKLDAKDTRSAWYKALESTGVAVQVWPVDARNLPRWIAQRAGSMGLKLDGEAAQLLAERGEGNLLAAVQELEKLRLAHGAGYLDLETVLAETANSARFSVFDLSNSALAGQTARAVRILHGLAEEGVAKQVVSWALVREVQTVSAVVCACARGQGMADAMRQSGVWKAREAGVRAAVNRLSGEQCRSLIQAAASADRVVKGAPGDAWLALERLVLGLCGVTILAQAPNIVPVAR